jgi:MFS family permease
MSPGARRIQRTYLILTLSSTLAASLIWGINTLFLLDAGLSNTQAFAANAFYTAGQLVFELPTGVVADAWGRRVSYLLGAVTLLVSTLLYLLMWQIEGPFWGWAVSSALIGLGFTFFSGAVEAWLVDALTHHDYDGSLESVFGRGQTMGGVAMLSGSIAGGVIAQTTSLGVPYVVRAALLIITFGAAFVLMREEGFTPTRPTSVASSVKDIVSASIDGGWRKPPIRWLMLAAPFTGGVGVYAFYAMQPYLLELFGNEAAFGIAGLAAAIFAGAQIVGGLLVPAVRRVFRHRTNVLLAGTIIGTATLILMGWTASFWVAIVLVVVWALSGAATTPIRQAYVNGLIPSEQRATVLSFDALMSSAGGVGAQPVLGRAADVWGYGTSYVVGGIIQIAAIPFVALARRERAPSDPLVHTA